MKRILLLAACIVALAACGGDSALPSPTGKGSIRMINAMPGSPPVRFLIEQRLLAPVNYKDSSSPDPYDDFSYTFNFEIAEPGQSEPTRIASQSLTVEKDREHIFMLSGDVNSPDITIFNADTRTFDEAETVFEARFVHGGATAGDIDIYFDPAGTAPGTNPPVATLTFGTISDPADFEAGEYVLTVTAAGDVNTVLFTAQNVDLLDKFAHVITVFDGDANDTAPVAVRSMTSVGNPLTFADGVNPPQTRFIHTALNLDAVDVYDDDLLTSLVTSDLQFQSATADLDSVNDTRIFYFTPAGSTAQILFEQQITFPSAATFSDVYVVGTETETVALRFASDRAAHATSARLSIFHGASNYTLWDAYLVDPGAELTDETGPILIAIGFSQLSSTIELLEGSYDLYLTERGARDPITAAFPIDLVNGSVTQLIAVDTVDPAVVEIIDVSAP